MHKQTQNGQFTFQYLIREKCLKSNGTHCLQKCFGGERVTDTLTPRNSNFNGHMVTRVAADTHQTSINTLSHV
jgi:hypothetical protein